METGDTEAQVNDLVAAGLVRAVPLTREDQLAALRNQAAETTDTEELVNLQGQIQDLESQPASNAGAADRGAIHWIAARGTFYAVSLLEEADASGNAPSRCYGLYQMEVDQAADQTPRNIRGFDNLTMTGARGNQPILLTAVTLGQRDIVGQAACLENQKVFYTFGQNFGNIQITGEILLGALADAKAQDEGIQTLREFFANYRVSVFKKPVAVTISRNEAVFAYLVGLDIGNLDSEFNILPFTFHGVLLDLAKTPVGSVNPQGSVTVDGVQVLTEKLLDEPQELKRLLALRDLPEVEAAAVEKKKSAKAEEPAVGDVVQTVIADPTARRNQRETELQALKEKWDTHDDRSPEITERINALKLERVNDNVGLTGWAVIDYKTEAGVPLNQPEKALVRHRENLAALRPSLINPDVDGTRRARVDSYMAANGAEIKELLTRSGDYRDNRGAAVDDYKKNFKKRNAETKAALESDAAKADAEQARIERRFSLNPFAGDDKWKK